MSPHEADAFRVLEDGCYGAERHLFQDDLKKMSSEQRHALEVMIWGGYAMRYGSDIHLMETARAAFDAYEATQLQPQEIQCTR